MPETTGTVARRDPLKNTEGRDDLRVSLHVWFHVASYHRTHAPVRRREAKEGHGIRIGKNVELDQLGRNVHHVSAGFGTHTNTRKW